MGYKLIVSDLDGTLLRSDRTISVSNIEAVKSYIIREDIQFCIASGRPPYFIDDTIRKFHLGKNMRYAICYNGGLIYDFIDNKAIFKEEFEPNDAKKIVEYFVETQVKIVIFSGEKVYVNKDIESVRNVYGARVSLFSIDIFNFSKDKINKISAFGFNPELPKNIYDSAKFSFYGEDNGLVKSEISPRNINKGFGVEKICKLLNIRLGEVLAFGDAANDIEMLQVSGWGVSPANAEHSAKNVANEISNNTNEEDFVGRYLGKQS